MTEQGDGIGRNDGADNEPNRATLVGTLGVVGAGFGPSDDVASVSEAESGVDWLRALETVDADEIVVGGGRLDFALGAALAGVNLFVSAGVIAAWLLKTAGIVAVLLLHQTVLIDNPAAVEFVIAGALFGLALGVAGFAFFARRGWTSYYWPLFGITIALGSSVIAGRS
jgi:hypothetical protein